MNKLLTYIVVFLVAIAIKPAMAEPVDNATNTDLHMCKVDAVGYMQTISRKLPMSPLEGSSVISLNYLNTVVQGRYTEMTDAVTQHVAVNVAMSLFSFNSESLSAENIALHISMGTKPYLPFSFANGVEITDANSQGNTIIYKTRMPISKTDQQAETLALAGRVSTVASVCNDEAVVDDLLKRHIVIQYDYYDSNDEFVSSFTINGNQMEQSI